MLPFAPAPNDEAEDQSSAVGSASPLSFASLFRTSGSSSSSADRFVPPPASEKASPPLFFPYLFALAWISSVMGVFHQMFAHDAVAADAARICPDATRCCCARGSPSTRQMLAVPKFVSPFLIARSEHRFAPVCPSDQGLVRHLLAQVVVQLLGLLCACNGGRRWNRFFSQCTRWIRRELVLALALVLLGHRVLHLLLEVLDGLSIRSQPAGGRLPFRRRRNDMTRGRVGSRVRDARANEGCSRTRRPGSGRRRGREREPQGGGRGRAPPPPRRAGEL